jgi:hypothetical protein
MNDSNNDNNEDDITLVTAFLDIGRGEWADDIKRSPSFYTDSFATYLNYPYKMVCYIDDKYIDDILKKYSTSPYQNKRFIPINREWLLRNIRAWKNIENDRIIMNSDKFKDFLKGRLPHMYPEGIPETNVRNHLCPENVFPEYNIINHSKIDFIANAIMNGYITTKYTGWSDFGYFKSYHYDGTLPKSTIDVNKLKPDKITFCTRRRMIPDDTNMMWTLLFGHELFIGAFYAGPTELMLRFQHTYHEAVNKMYEHFISDDDQHVYIQCYCLNPELMHLEIFAGKDWPKLLDVFSK